MTAGPTADDVINWIDATGLRGDVYRRLEADRQAAIRAQNEHPCSQCGHGAMSHVAISGCNHLEHTCPDKDDHHFRIGCRYKHCQCSAKTRDVWASAPELPAWCSTTNSPTP